MRNDFFPMHGIEAKLGSKINEQKSPEQIRKIFQALNYDNISDDTAMRLSLLSMPTKRRCSTFQDSEYICEILPVTRMAEVNEIEAQTESVASLEHDIGKTGPAKASLEEQKSFVALFNLSFYQRQYDGLSPQELPLKKALEIKVREEDLTREQAEEILQNVLSAVKKQKKMHFETKINAQTPMGTVWAAHVYWTYEILKQNERPDNEIDRRMTEIAACHHLLDDHDPMQKGIENADEGIISLELSDKYQAFRIRLILADKYQAFRERGALNHEDAIKAVRKMIDDRLAGAGKTHELYLTFLRKLEENGETLEKELDLK
ncbi:MAG: hypothetical protein V1928_00345 [Parcubacteria group bacterium]